MENTGVVVNNEVELVSLKLAKKHLKLDADYDEEDELIEVAIASAISQAENYTERKFDSSDLPKPVLSAILLLISDTYEKREDRNQGNNTVVNNLLRPYRKWQ